MKFAKIFEMPDNDQVLVMVDRCSGCRMPVVSAIISLGEEQYETDEHFPDTPEGQDAARDRWNDLDEADASTLYRKCVVMAAVSRNMGEDGPSPLLN
jgi:hypothetical protein